MKGKKIDVWKIYHENDLIEFEVRMYKGNEGIKFQATNGEFEYRKTGYDLNKLRREVEEDCKTFNRFKYEPKLIIELDDNHSNFSQQDEVPDTAMLTEINPDSDDLYWGIFKQRIDLEVHRMLVGKTNTKSLSSGEDDLVAKYGPRGSASHHWREHGIDDEGVIHAELDDTTENREALQRILSGIAKLREQLRTLMHPDTLEVTLKAINASGGVKFLPAGEPEKAVEKPKKKRRR